SRRCAHRGPGPISRKNHCPDALRGRHFAHATSAAHGGTIRPAVIIAFALCWALLGLFFGTTSAMPEERIARPNGRPANLGPVPQAHVDPRVITLPVVDATDLRFTRLSTDDGLSQTRVTQILQDDRGFIW